MQLNSYVTFSGDCRQAFEFYAETLGGKVEFVMTHGEAPGPKPSLEWRDKILHACLAVGDQRLMGSDRPTEHFQKPQGFSVQLDIEKSSDAERVFRALSQGGQVSMPMEQTFWAERFGMLIDRFGLPWMINCQGNVQMNGAAAS